MVKKCLHIVSGFCLLIVFSCAQVVAPTGGAKDTEPPKVVEAKPENGSLNFNAKKVIIEFDEFPVLKNLKENLIVSPPLKYALNTEIKGKRLEIVFKDTLQENTTYVLNFGNSLVDLTESNPIPNFQYVFSTGDQLDTLAIRGRVIDAFSLSVEENITVLLHKKSENDSLFTTEIPNYVSRANKEGVFHLSNVQEGEYNLYALQDKNNNFIFDRVDEKIAFLDSSITINDTSQFFILKTFQAAEEKQFIESKVEKHAKLLLNFKKEPTDLQFEVLNNDSDLQLLKLEQQSDTAIFWWQEAKELELKLAIADGETIIDTVKFKVDSFPKKSELKLISNLNKTYDYFRAIPLKFNRPIQNMNKEYINVTDGSGNAIVFQLEKDSTDDKLLYLSFPFKADSTYRVNLFPNSFQDIYNRTIDSSSNKVSFNQAEDFGQLSIVFDENSTTAKIIQLTDQNGKVIREEKTNTNRVVFKHLLPSSYRLKLIEDRNENGKWDTGNYYLKEQAEKTFLFDESITVRKNWDKEIKWLIK